MALLTALFATALLMGLGLSIVLLGSAETTLASHDRDARALAYASKAAIAVAAADLRARPSWSALLAPGAVPEASASPGRFVDPTLAPATPWNGDPPDLRALTGRLQADSDAVTSLGGDAPTWRLFEYGSLARLVRRRRRRPGTPTTSSSGWRMAGGTGTVAQPPIVTASSWSARWRTDLARRGRLPRSRCAASGSQGHPISSGS
jgi:hypothetical protein